MHEPATHDCVVFRESGAVVVLHVFRMIVLLRSLARVVSSSHLQPVCIAALSTKRHFAIFPKKMSPKDRLIWIDCEMTGLDVNKQTLVEIACIITEGNLATVAEGPDLVIHQSPEVMDKMDDWCKETFSKNGLWEAIKQSGISMEQAEQTLLDFVSEHTEFGKCPLAGNTVSMDRRFIDKYMPRLGAHLHYRTVDVSSIKELCRRWYPGDFSRAPKKRLAHRALDDIRDSISELQYYRAVIFKPAGVDYD